MKDERVRIPLPESLRAAVQEVAYAERRTLSQMCLVLIERALLARNGKPK